LLEIPEYCWKFDDIITAFFHGTKAPLADHHVHLLRELQVFRPSVMHLFSPRKFETAGVKATMIFDTLWIFIGDHWNS